MAGLAPLVVAAQQLVCQQQFGSYVTPWGFNTRFNGLAAISPDSVLLYRLSSSSGFALGQPQRAGLLWVRRGSCDTIRFASLPAQRQPDYPAYILRTRRGQLRVAQILVGSDSIRLWFSAFSRLGQRLWAHLCLVNLIHT